MSESDVVRIAELIEAIMREDPRITGIAFWNEGQGRRYTIRRDTEETTNANT